MPDHKASTLDQKRHTLAHLLAMAVLKKYPKAKLGIGPVIDDGFYYDFDIGKKTFREEDLAAFEKTMRDLISQKLAIVGKKISPAAAKRIYKDQPFKRELIKEYSKAGKALTVYTTGNFTDLCKGGHIHHTGEIPPDSFTLSRIAGAYWRGDENNPQLQRIYGLAFDTAKELNEYRVRLEETRKRDHRKLGKDLELFAIIDEIGPGLPLFYPKGAVLRRTIENFIQHMQEARGYTPIWIPHITKSELYRISGHLDKFDALYPPMELEKESLYYLKPMNCPHFMMLYKTLPHSYRELPIRWTSTTTNYRYEKSGELSGLTRVRSLTQDDCHVFAAPDHIEDEINLMLDMIEETYRAFGFTDFWVRISTHDPKRKTGYMGDPKIWKQAEEILSRLVAKRGWAHKIGVGEAAFYGPKLDFIFKDVLGREWQLSTVQLDMNLSKRFKLEYMDRDGAKKEPIVIHRAILGSTERFLGILIEHFAGAFPFWLSPVQAKILTINERVLKYARDVMGRLERQDIRIELDDRNESIGKKIREAELQKIPYLLIIGEKEASAGTIAVRERGKGSQGAMSIDKLIEILYNSARSKL